MRLPPFRAVARVAWRQAWGSKGRSALVVVMVALPIGGLSTAAIAIRTATETPQERVLAIMGSADLLVYPSRGVDAADIEAALPAGAAVAERRSAYAETAAAGSFVQVFLTELSIPTDRPPSRGLFLLLDGRLPSASGEATVSPRLLAFLNAQVGDTVTLEDFDLAFRITGTAVQRNEPTFPLAVLGPGSLDDLAAERPGLVQTEAFLVDLPPGASAEESWQALVDDPKLQGGVSLRAMEGNLPPDDPAAATGWSFAVTTGLLLGTGLIAGAAFAVGARRQLRTLGLLGAAGGEPRHVRATVLVGGVALGCVGGLAGVALGIVGGFAIHPHLDRFAGRIVGPVRIPVLPLVGAIALGTLAGALAALGPARSAGRLTTVQALSGRLPTPRRPGRIAGAGVVAVGGGAAITAVATPAHSNIGLLLGLGVMTAGFLVAIPLLVTWTGRLAGSLPTLPRLSTRDIARHGRRTGTALAAAVIALALPVAVSAITLSQEALDRRVPYLANDQLMIELVGLNPELDLGFLDEFRSALPGSVIAPLVSAAASVDRGGRTVERFVSVQGPEHVDPQGGTWSIGGAPAIGYDDLLYVLHAEDGVRALEEGKIVGLGPESVDLGPDQADAATVKLFVGQGARQRALDLAAVEAGSTTYIAMSAFYVISPARAADLGLSPSEDSAGYPQYVLRATAPLDDEQIERAKSIAARHQGIAVRAAGDYVHGAGGARLLISGIAIALALAIVFVIVALVGAESRRDQAILVAIGGEPRIRRAVAGARALAFAVLAGLLAVPAGFAPAAVFRVAQAHGYPIVLPWTTIVLVLLVTPLVAGLFAALVSRQPRAAHLLRPIE
jgi:putative ABC transport system permease protein